MWKKQNKTKQNKKKQYYLPLVNGEFFFFRLSFLSPHTFRRSLPHAYFLITTHRIFLWWDVFETKGSPFLCRYETIEEMKEAVTKVIDTLTQEDFHGAFQKLLERYNKCIASGGDYFEGDLSFMCVLAIKVPIRKTSGNLFNEPRISSGVKEQILLSCSISKTGELQFDER